MNTAPVLVELLKEYRVEYIRSVRITHPDQLDAAITEAMQSNEPAFNDVPTKSELDEVPPVHAWQAALREVGTLKHLSRGGNDGSAST